MTETYSFGEWLKQRREHLRLTQREVANTVYCSVPMIKKIEADERHPSPELAELLASALHIPESNQATFVEVARGERPVDALWQLTDPPAVVPVPSLAPIALPIPVTPLIGRADELAEISERLSQLDCRLLTLVGIGGMGKSRLALAAAHSLQTDFADGAVFVSLAAVTDAKLIPDAVARSLRLTLIGDAAEQVLAYLRRRRMLLILDNCEQLEGDLIWLSDVLAQSPNINIVATSRERLHLAEEWVYIVPELAQSADLFVASARRVKSDFDAEAERPAITRICHLVENLPLAIELAASWIAMLSCDQIADHIQSDLNMLATDVRNIPSRHRSMQAVFDHSWNLLSDAEQKALMRLAVFRGGWQAAESESVADANLLLLRRLVDKSLVRVVDNGRYDLHELIRQYAFNKLVESGQETAAYQRHFDAYLALAAKLDAEQYSAQSMVVVARFSMEHDNFRVAIGWGLDVDQIEAVLGLLNHLSFYWSRRGYYHEASQWTVRAIHQAGEMESVPFCVALSTASVFLFVQGNYGEAEPLAHRGMAMARRLEDPEALITALGTYTFSSVNIEQALNGINEGITLVRETGKLENMLPLFYLGAATWFHSSGRHMEASDYYRQSIALFRKMGVVDFIADPLGRLGQLALGEGRIQEAYDLTVESIAAARSTGYDMVFSAWGGVRLGLIQLYLGQLEAAEQTVKEALLFFEDGKDVRVKQEALEILSEVALARGNVSAAAEHLGASLDICQAQYDQLQATQKLEGTPDALPINLMTLSARASLVSAGQGGYARAATLQSIAHALSIQSGQRIIAPLLARLDDATVVIRAHLSDSDFDTAWNIGQRVSLKDAFEFLLAYRPLA